MPRTRRVGLGIEDWRAVPNYSLRVDNRSIERGILVACRFVVQRECVRQYSVDRPQGPHNLAVVEEAAEVVQRSDQERR